MAPGRTGLKKFGRQAVKAMEKAGILIDISHASPRQLVKNAVKHLVDEPLRHQPRRGQLLTCIYRGRSPETLG